MKTEIETVNADMVQLYRFVAEFESRISKLEHDRAVLDPASPGGYERIDTNLGPFLVSLETVEPYLDGYKAVLRIGNPFAVDLKGFKVYARWGPRQRTDGYAAWLKTLRGKEFSFTDTLTSGRWNRATVILPETKSNEFGYLEIGLSTDVVALGIPLR